MICDTCKAAAEQGRDLPLVDAQMLHAGCKGGSHCDCQHIPTSKQEDGSLAQRRQ